MNHRRAMETEHPSDLVVLADRLSMLASCFAAMVTPALFGVPPVCDLWRERIKEQT